MKEIIRNVVSNVLTGKNYEPELVKKWTITIANEVNGKVKGKFLTIERHVYIFYFADLNMKRYKHIVQVILGERKGAGIRSAVRCIWDSDVDSYTSDIFTNVSNFCCPKSINRG